MPQSLDMLIARLDTLLDDFTQAEAANADATDAVAPVHRPPDPVGAPFPAGPAPVPGLGPGLGPAAGGWHGRVERRAGTRRARRCRFTSGYRGRMGEILSVTLMLEPHGPAGAFVLSDEQVAAVGGGRRAFPVRLGVNGVTLPLRVARMGGKNLIGLARAAREEAGVTIGAEYLVEIVAEDAERTVEVPDDLATALSGDAPASAAFGALAYSHRKEFVRWISEARREETRAQRVTRTIEMLRAGQHR